MSRRAKKNAARAVLGAVLLAMALFALLPFVYMGLVSLTQKTVLDLRFDPAEFSFKNYARVFSNFNIGRNLLNSVIVTGGACVLNCIVCAMAAYGFFDDLILPACVVTAFAGFFLLLAGFFLNRHEIAPTLAGFLAMLFLWMFGFGFAFRFRGSSQPMLLNLVLLLTPAILIAIVFTLLVTGSAGILMSAGLFCFAAAFIHNILNLAKSRDDQEGVLLCQQLTVARAYFRRELEKDRPDLEDAWFPYLMAFGLGDRVDSWFRQYGETGISGGSLASSGGGTSGFTGGGGRFGGGGASGAWMTAVGSVAAGSSSSSSGGGGGSSGGGGGGGW